jgi:hypothetical protein
MSSERQITANRLNGRKSRGPRAAAGKSIASRNALRHGLAAVTHKAPAPNADVERLARALCGRDFNPALYQQALVVAANEMALRAIAAQQILVVERVHDAPKIALAKGDDRIRLAKLRAGEGRRAYAKLMEVQGRLLEKYQHRLRPVPQWDLAPAVTDFIRPDLHLVLEGKKTPLSPEQLRQYGLHNFDDEEPKQRDASAAMAEAAVDLVRLERYQRRAWLRQRRAIYAFMNLILNSQHQPATVSSGG